MMRLIDRDTVLVVELISLVDTPNGVELRFRHFLARAEGLRVDVQAEYATQCAHC
jgi:hypothetical protein